MVRLTERPDITLDVYRGRKTTIQQQQQLSENGSGFVVHIPLLSDFGISVHVFLAPKIASSFQNE